MCSDCEAYGLKKHGLTRSDCMWQTGPHFGAHINFRPRLCATVKLFFPRVVGAWNTSPANVDVDLGPGSFDWFCSKEK